MAVGLAPIAAGAALVALLLGAAVLLRAWQSWLELKQLQLSAAPKRPQRSEVRDLRDRVRKLERIALGLD